MIIILTIIAFLGALVLGFLGGRDSMLSDLKRKEDELYDAHALIDKMNEERREYFYAAEAEKEELKLQIMMLKNGKENTNEDMGSQN